MSTLQENRESIANSNQAENLRENTLVRWYTSYGTASTSVGARVWRVENTVSNSVSLHIEMLFSVDHDFLRIVDTSQ